MSRRTERNRIIKSFDVYDVPDIYRDLIKLAIESNHWDWFNDMDGCSFVPDYWKTKFYPPCLVHDYHWRTGRGGYWSDRIFLELMEIYSLPKWQRNLRFVMVRVGWFGFYKWKHKMKGNFRKFDTITKIIINKWKN